MQPETENSLKSTGFWPTLISATILVGALPFLFTPQDLLPDHRLLPQLLNVSHIPYFFLLTRIGLGTLGPWRGAGFVGLLLIANLVVLLLGIGIESIQLWQGRQGSAGDLTRNAIGASLAVMLHPRAPRPHRALRLSLILGLTTILLIELYPLCRHTVDWIQARNRFPVLADFETPFQRERWRGGEIVRLDDSANRVIRFRFDTAKYSTLSLVHLEGDWRGYDCFRFLVFNPQTNRVRLSLRINDLEHDLSGQRYDDRFNRALAVQPGWNAYAFDLVEIANAPKSRKMNLAEIERILFFTSAQLEPATLYFDDLLLDREKERCPTVPVTDIAGISAHPSRRE